MGQILPATPASDGARWLALGAVIGLLASSLLVGGWHHSGSGVSVTVLGAGRQASVLITANHRRVLIAAGTNGSAFSNAIGEALPPVYDSLELVLLDPGSSQDVQERVRALDTNLIWILPATSEPKTADAVEQSFTVELDSQTRLHVRIDEGGSWQAELASTAGQIVITPNAATIATLAGVPAVAIFTHEQESVETPAPVIAGLPGISTSSSQQIRAASPGSIVRIELAGGEVRIEAALHRSVT